MHCNNINHLKTNKDMETKTTSLLENLLKDLSRSTQHMGLFPEYFEGDGWLSSMLGIEHPDFPESYDQRVQQAWADLTMIYSKIRYSVISVTPEYVFWNLELRAINSPEFDESKIHGLINTIFDDLETATSTSYADNNMVLITYVGYV